MNNPLISLIIGFETIVGISICLFIFLVFLYYISEFLENKIEKFIFFIKIFIILMIINSILLYDVTLNLFSYLITIFNNLIWLILTFKGYPLKNYPKNLFVLCIIITIITHFIWNEYFFNKSKNLNTFLIISYFFTIIWGTPILLLSCMLKPLTKLDKNKPKGLWKDMFLEIYHQSMIYLNKKTCKR